MTKDTAREELQEKLDELAVTMETEDGEVEVVEVDQVLSLIDSYTSEREREARIDAVLFGNVPCDNCSEIKRGYRGTYDKDGILVGFLCRDCYVSEASRPQQNTTDKKGKP